jgi:hypothetical protein
MLTVQARQEEIDARWDELVEQHAAVRIAIEAMETCFVDDEQKVAAFKAMLEDQHLRMLMSDYCSEDGNFAAVARDPAITKALADCFKGELAKIDDEMLALTSETLRLHPEEFTQLPNGNWIDNARAIKH